MFSKDFILSPDKTVVPAYRISPFRTSDISANRALPASTAVDDYFRQRFPDRGFIYCESGRQAIHFALRALSLSRTDAVTIFTTTGNFYISGCVTREIEQFCNWSRKLEPNSQALLVNHEFGFPYEDLQSLRKFNLPIIEDAAHSFVSDNGEQSVSRVGDFTIYSLPKFFPVQFGGLLVFNPRFSIEETLAPEAKQYLQKVLSAHIPALPQICQKRRDNHGGLASRFQTIRCTPRFELSRHSVPGVFMFRAPADVDLPGLKTFAQAHGIESSVFYGEQAFFVPVHHRLEPADLDYFLEIVRSFY
jgi:hypothetical protein